MDNSQKVATVISILLAVLMLCGGSVFLGYVRGYHSGHEGSYTQAYSQGKDAGYQAGYESGLQAGTKLEPEQKASSNEYTLRNPAYLEVKTFLAQDPTSSNTYIEDNYVCVDFAAAVKNNAEAQGIRCAIVDIFYPDGYGHTIIAFDTIDRGLIYIEPQFDQEVKLVVDSSYSQLNNFTAAPRDDTIKRYLIVW
ncbi:MAG: hypothetical protein MUO89_05460 [Dehalococcoidia bacterium]|nr:hypothetical protein [Dehalococcoidia bacterium]